MRDNNRKNYMFSQGVNPTSEVDKRKIEEDRRIRQQQEEEYNMHLIAQKEEEEKIKLQ